jgi:hypothetical protein
LENLDDEVDFNKAWETIRDNINYELKKHKPWFDKGYSELLDKRKEAKLQWLQDPSEINGDDLNNIRRKVNRHLRK